MTDVLLRVRVNAGARKERYVQKDARVVEIDVKENAERNAANQRVCELLASRLGVPKRRTQVIKGMHSSKKLIAVTM